MRKRDENAFAVSAYAADHDAERRSSPETLDRHLPDQEDDARPYERELADEPRCAVRDLGRRRPAVTASALRLAGEALRDRGAIRQVRLVDARAREPSLELGAGASREGHAGRKLHRARRLPDDHDAIARVACDDGER